MEIFIERTKQTLKINYQGKVSELLKKLKINKEAVIIVRNNKIITLDQDVKNKDKIKILSVISGG